MIRQVAHKYGVVKVFKAYAAVSEVISPRLSTLRSELTACGVSFVDCPHNGRKDVADKMMIGMSSTSPRFIPLRDGFFSGHDGVRDGYSRPCYDRPHFGRSGLCIPCCTLATQEIQNRGNCPERRAYQPQGTGFSLL